MASEEGRQDRAAQEIVAGLRTSGRAGLLIVTAGLGILAAIGLVRRYAERHPTAAST